MAYKLHSCDDGHPEVFFVDDIPVHLRVDGFCPVCKAIGERDEALADLDAAEGMIDELKQELADEKSKKTV